MLGHTTPTRSFLFLFDRSKVYSFLSLIYRCMLKQRGCGGLQGQCGLLERDAKGFLFYTGGRVPCQALVALGPFTVAGWIVYASYTVQRQGCSEGGACFGKTWVGG